MSGEGQLWVSGPPVAAQLRELLDQQPPPAWFARIVTVGTVVVLLANGVLVVAGTASPVIELAILSSLLALMGGIFVTFQTWKKHERYRLEAIRLAGELAQLVLKAEQSDVADRYVALIGEIAKSLGELGAYKDAENLVAVTSLLHRHLYRTDDVGLTDEAIAKLIKDVG
jgi:hypothetical protein